MLKLTDIMETEVLTVAPELTLRDLVGVLTDHGVTGAPVVANGRVVGVVSATDVLELEEGTPGPPVERTGSIPDTEWTATERWEEWGEEEGTPVSEYFTHVWEPQEVDVYERMAVTDRPEWDVLEEHTVSEVMSRKLVTLPPDAPVKQAAERMLEADVHRILVMEGEELKGIVTTTDIVRAVGDARLT